MRKRTSFASLTVGLPSPGSGRTYICCKSAASGNTRLYGPVRPRFHMPKRVDENGRRPVRCALSCVVRWSTQPLLGYTGLILRQLGCNNLCLLATNPRNSSAIHSATGGRSGGTNPLIHSAEDRGATILIL